MFSRKIRLAGLILLGLSLLGSACGPAVSTVAPTGTTAATPSHVVSKTTWVQAEYGEPETLDPALDYESAGGEVLLSLYDTLITYEKESPIRFVPNLAVEVPAVENGGISQDRLTYTFKIRDGVQFHDGTPLTVEDVAYTFQRGILQGGLSSPQWLFTEALFGAGFDDIAAVIDPENPPYDDMDRLVQYPSEQLAQVCQDLTQKIIVADPAARTVTFHLKQPWATFLPAFAGSWGSITSKKWVSTNGGWDGSCATWQKYYGLKSEQSIKTNIGSSAMGTGPYKLDHWTPGTEIVLTANENYWRKTPAWPGGPVGAAVLKKVILKDVQEFATRLAMLQNGEADYISVNSDQWPIVDKLVGEKCDEKTGACSPSGAPEQPLKMVYDFTTGNRTDLFFNFNVNPEGNTFIGSGKLDGAGIPPDFFSDIHIRRAFAYCFDYGTFLREALQNDAVRSTTVMLPGMIGYDENLPVYQFDPVKCEEEFKASTLKSEDGKGVWETGFHLTATYNIGNTVRQMIAQILQQNLYAVNSKFIVEVTGLPWSTYQRAQRARQMPVFTEGWIMDLYDTHNWVVPYSTGTFGNRQSLPKELQDQFRQIYSQGVTETDPALRGKIYKEFTQLYYDQVPALILYQVNGRRYLPRYVDGWYYNPIYPGDISWYAISKK